MLDAEQRGFDAIALGNILDQGRREARSMVDIPARAPEGVIRRVAAEYAESYHLRDLARPETHEAGD